MRHGNLITTGLIRSACTEDAPMLTAIAFAAKRHWKYPEHYFDNWKSELTITARYISGTTVFVYESQSVPVAFVSLSEWKEDVPFKGEVLPAGLWLEHLFVEPAHMYKGVGAVLFRFSIDHISENNGKCIRILSDPNASGFYLKMGCILVKEVPSSIEGRTTPLFEYYL